MKFDEVVLQREDGLGEPKAALTAAPAVELEADPGCVMDFGSDHVETQREIREDLGIGRALDAGGCHLELPTALMLFPVGGEKPGTRQRSRKDFGFV